MALMETLLQQMQASNILLFIALIVLFVVAYKVLRAVINAAIVAVLSGAFLVVLSYVGLGPQVTVNRFMFFMVLGTALFIIYSGIATVIRTSTTLLGALRKIGGWLSGPFSGKDEDEDSGGSEKEIVLEELKDDD
ncbi:MAG: hypothetical protein ABEJ62_00970 [Candidatus Nanohaloarchaea archaeon]